MHSLENLVAVMKWNSYIKLRRIVRPRALIGNNKHACLSIGVFSQPTGLWMVVPALQIVYCDEDTSCVNPAGFRLLWVWLQNAHYAQPIRIVAFCFPVLFLLSTRFDLRKSTGAREMLQIQNLKKICICSIYCLGKNSAVYLIESWYQRSWTNENMIKLADINV